MQAVESPVETALISEILATNYEWEDCGVMYARFSPGGQQNEQSIEGQLRENLEFVKRQKIKIVGIYIDRKISGRYDDRPEFQKMLTDSRKKQFKYVVVWKFDRFARNRYDSAIYKHKLKQYDVKVISASERISDGPEGVLIEALLEANAEYYSLELAQKIRRGNRESKLKGRYTGGPLPWGYKVDADKHIVIDEEKAPVLREIFQDYAEGVPRKKIIDNLNARGFRARNGKPFGHSALARFFANEKYIGKYVYDGEQRDGYYPPIIDEATFEKARARLMKNRHNAAPKAKIEYLLSGKLFCGHCGAAMLGDAGTSKQGNRHYYYTCGERKRKHTCNKKSEKKDYIEWYIVEQTLLYVLDPQRIEYIAGRIIDEYEKEFNSGIVGDLERRAKDAEKELDKATEAYIDAPPAARKRIADKINELDQRLKDINVDLIKMRVACDIRYTKDQIIAWIKSFANGDPLDLDFRKRIIAVFINSVYLYDDKTVIYYNVKDGKQISYMDVIDSLDELNESDISDDLPENSAKAPENGLNDAGDGFGYYCATSTKKELSEHLSCRKPGSDSFLYLDCSDVSKLSPPQIPKPNKILRVWFFFFTLGYKKRRFKAIQQHTPLPCA